MGRALFAPQTSMPIMQNVFIKHPKRSKRQEENDYFGKIKRKKPEIRENDESYLLTCTPIFVEPWRGLTV